MKEVYDPSALFEVAIKTKRERYKSLVPLVSLNTISGTLSFNKKALEGLAVLGTKRLKVRFLSNGFKLFVDSIISPDTPYIMITKASVGCSMAICLELKKHYKIPENHKAVFNLVEVEKYRFRLDLKKTEPLKKKPVTT